jgi:isoleucyl-tRNA synthetase
LISTQDIPGWAVTSEGNFTVALDMTITDDLFEEGMAREIVNRVQTLRKNSGFEVTDRIVITIEKNENIETVVERFNSYICSETLANSIQIVDKLEGDNLLEDELTDNVNVRMKITKS